MSGAGDIEVSFGLKELLGNIDGRLASIDTKLDSKADTREFERLAQRVDAQGQQIRSLGNRLDVTEKLSRDRERVASYAFTKREKTIGLVIAAAAVAAPYLFHTGGLA